MQYWCIDENIIETRSGFHGEIKLLHEIFHYFSDYTYPYSSDELNYH